MNIIEIAGPSFSDLMVREMKRSAAQSLAGLAVTAATMAVIGVVAYGGPIIYSAGSDAFDWIGSKMPAMPEMPSFAWFSGEKTIDGTATVAEQTAPSHNDDGANFDNVHAFDGAPSAA